MKYRSRSFFLLVFGLHLIGFLACSDQEKEDFQSSSTDKLDLKHYPGEHFFLQRSYPDRSFDYKAYKTALEGIKANRNSRNATAGFTEPWTVQGPGNAGARINTIAIHPNNADTIFVGFSGGGIFKTTDGGTNWFPVFDDQPYLAIGDITIDPVNPDIVYVGTGDPNITGYPFIGDGVYKSTDGGLSWNHMGLSDQRIVSKIMIDPSDPDIVYAACMGLPFERNNERGLYKSTDGGNTWTQKLFVSNQSGIIDMLLNPNNPQILYAASWDRIRNNQESIVTGPNAKIHKSTDGGDTWTVLSNGLPTGEQGRIGLAMSGSDSDNLFAMYVGTDQQLEGVYKSTDAGSSWSALPTDSGTGLGTNALGGFGWYFGQIRVDPDNDNIIWILGVSLWKTSNSGSLWFMDNNGSPHVDNHELICYNNDLYLGTDGGMYLKATLSSPWSDIENIPTTQFYRTAYNPHQPGEYYGGTQDNGTQTGNETDPNDWSMILGGDGFQVVFNPDDPDVMYAETQRGNIFMKPDAASGFINATSGINSADRRNWDMQYILSNHNSNRLYTGTYRVYKSEENGLPFWQTISDDLTDGNIYGSTFHTITTLSESPYDEDLLYVGTTDGNVWRTEDGGTTWDSLHADLPNRYVTSIIASPDSADHVYVGFSGYRYNDFIPHIHLSTDRGGTWTDISGDLPQISVNNIFVMPGEGGQVIFVATDGGVYGTINGGQSWERLGNNMPMVPVYDVDWNEAENLLIAATFGRSIMTYPLDSIDYDANPDIVLTGNIQTENNEGVDSVLVSLDGGIPVQTDPNGDFDLGTLPFGTNCVISPQKDINYRNGVSTLDILFIQSHILTIDSLDSPYKIIAADVNNNGSVSAIDLIFIRKLILFDLDTFPDNNSWRFIDASYVFTNPFQPLNENFPEIITCNDVNGGSIDFIGLKVGDVSGNADPGEFSQVTENRNTNDTLMLFTENQEFDKNETIEVPIKIQKGSALHGFQFTLEFDPAVLEFQEITQTGISDFAEENCGKTFLNDGFLTMSWNSSRLMHFADGEEVFTLKFRTLGTNDLSSVLTINSKLTQKESYGEFFEIQEIDFVIFQTQHTIIGSSLKAFPNPFSRHCNISFNLQQSEPFNLTIFNTKGEAVKIIEKRGVKGKNEIILESADLPGAGVYYTRLQSGFGSKTTNLIFLD